MLGFSYLKGRPSIARPILLNAGIFLQKRISDRRELIKISKSNLTKILMIFNGLFCFRTFKRLFFHKNFPPKNRKFVIVPFKLFNESEL